MGGMPQAMPVQVEPVRSGTIQESSEFVGVLQAQNRVTLRPEADGQIEAILVSSGQAVDRGTPILQLRAAQTEAQAGSAIADIAAAQAARSSAAASVRAAIASRDSAAANVRLQSTEFQRTQALVAEGAQSRQALDRVRTQRDTAIATLRAAEQEVQARQADLAQSNATLQRAQAQQNVVQADLQDRQVTAPISGVVGNIPVKVGDFVRTGDTLASIIQNGTLELNLSVPLERSPQLREGLTVELLDADGKPFSRGTISFISPEVNTVEQSVLAKARFVNNGRLRDGQFVRARLIWESAPGVLVPTTAVTRIAGQTFVYVAETGEPAADGTPQQIARQRPVQLGPIQGNTYQVISGLSAGDRLITSGILNLQDEVPIVEASQTGGPPPQS